MIGFEYGNTRLRAMRSRLLSRRQYHEMTLAGSIDRLLGALHDTPYGPDVEGAMARFTGLQRLDEALRTNLGRTLQSMRGFYAERAGEQVELLLSHWDVANLRSILRGRARIAGDGVAPLLVAAGRLTDAELAELGAQSSVRSVVDLMVVWRVPSRRVARRVLDALPGFEMTGATLGLEQALYQEWAASVGDAVAEAEPDDPLAASLRRDIDRRNLMTCLRLRVGRRSARRDTAALEVDLLPGGFISHRHFEAIADTEEREQVLATLDTAGLPSGWLAPLTTWAANGDLEALEAGVEAAVTRAAVGYFRTADPLGIGIPVAFASAKENEVRNLRLIGRGLVHGLSADEVTDRLVVAA